MAHLRQQFGQRMGVVQEMRGICPVLANHAGERGAVAPPVGFAHLIGGGALQLQVLGDIVGHLLVDQRKHPGAGVVQGVIQVKDP